MAAEGAAAAAAAPPPRAAELAQAEQPFCSSVLCRVLTSAPFFVAGGFLIRTVRNTLDGQSERLRKPTVFARMALGLCLLSWGMTQLIFVPKKSRNP